jgi:biotin synthase-like enzyme
VFNFRYVKASTLGCVPVAFLALIEGTPATAQQELRFTTSVPTRAFIYAGILSVWA